MMMETTMHSKPKFVIIGGAGKIAKYHFEAIEKVGGEVVGVIDPISPDTDLYPWFTTFPEFQRYALVQRPEYFVILSLNHLHVEHSVWALKYADVICEKPLAISTSELAHLKSEESLGQTKVHPIMQMRKNLTLCALHEQFKETPPYEIHIEYILPRNDDYYNSWQGDKTKSGGIVFNIAIHMLDFLLWTFGEYHDLKVDFYHEMHTYGVLYFNKTKVNFTFSTDPNSTERRILEFDRHVIDLVCPLPLHTLAYFDIFKWEKPLSISDVEPTIKLCEEIRSYK